MNIADKTFAERDQLNNNPEFDAAFLCHLI